jgi:DNA polymerase elongation subunit (family B)
MFVDARLIQNRIHLIERDAQGNRNISNHTPPYVYYVEDAYGDWTALDGVRVKRHKLANYHKHKQEVEELRALGRRVYESDVPPVYRFLEERYAKDDNPPLHLTLIDIETDKDPERGWAKTNNPFMPITAVTLYNKWQNKFYTIATPPDTLTYDEACDLLESDPGDGFGPLLPQDGYIVVEDEATLLELFLDLIEDADITSGWNSALYDMPYIVGRIRIVFGGESVEDIEREDGEINKFTPSDDSIPYLLRLCALPDIPHLRLVEKYGNKEITFDFPGRPHCDYMEHYQKNNQEKKHSYALDYILNDEVKQTKVKYDGSLDQLQRNDFRRFIAYSRQDVAGLNVLDDKKKMIELANTVAHMSSVTFDKILGSVTKIEHAILRVLHRKKIVAFDKVTHDVEGAVPGAFVFEPEGGLVDWVCSFDINSLYPSLIRALNIGPETLIGQFDLARTEEKLREYLVLYKGDTAKAWSEFTGVLEYHDIIEENPVNLTLVFDKDGSEISLPAKEWKQFLLDNNYGVSANGTVFDLNREGIISECLTMWYADRANTRAESKKYEKLAAEAKAKGDLVKAEEYTSLANYYDMVQNSRKLILNSLYGALLNLYCRFYDSRSGRSVTLSGRVVTKHMCRFASELISGNYDFSSTIYGDTDSVAYNSIIDTPLGKMTIEELFLMGSSIHTDGNDVELNTCCLPILTFDLVEKIPLYHSARSVYRHKVSKSKWKIIAGGKEVEVTGDHSIMVMRNDQLVELKPSEIKLGDLVVIAE